MQHVTGDERIRDTYLMSRKGHWHTLLFLYIIYVIYMTWRKGSWHIFDMKKGLVTHTFTFMYNVHDVKKGIVTHTFKGWWDTLVTPSTQSNLFPKSICFFHVETHKVSTYIRGGFHVLLHKTFLEQVHSARSSCTADAWPLDGFENGPNLADNKIEYLLLTTWDGNSIFFSANRALPSSQQLPFNGFTEWNFLRNKEKAYQNRE